MADTGSADTAAPLARLSAAQRALLQAAGSAAADAGGRAFLVGGVVRDLLLGRESHDLDVTVEGDASAVARALRARFGGRVHLHRAFLTATLELGGGLRLDLATARRERYRRPGALPEVAPGRLAEDLLRRDFSVNAMAVALSGPSFGELIDPHRGLDDLRRGAIRVLHGASFLDDPTRAIRAVRFANRLGFRIARTTARLIGDALSAGAFAGLSAQRLRREIELLFDEPGAPGAVRLLGSHGLLAVLHPRLKTDAAALARIRRVERVLERHRAARRDRAARWVIVLAALLHGCTPAVRAEVLGRLRPRRLDRRVLAEAPQRVRGVVGGLGPRGTPPASRVHDACRDQPTEVLLLVQALTSRVAVRRALDRYLDELRWVRPDINGRLLLRAGVPAGPAVAAGLNAALRAKLDGAARSADEQLAVALRTARLTATGRSSIP